MTKGPMFEDSDSCIDISCFRQVFLGECMGVGLDQRDDDLHVCFTILAQDDGHWFASDESASSYWLPELAAQLQVALDWCEKNCDGGSRSGWKFKSG